MPIYLPAFIIKPRTTIRQRRRQRQIDLVGRIVEINTFYYFPDAIRVTSHIIYL